MSGSVTQPRRPMLGGQRALPKDVVSWKATVLQRLGWQSKTSQQEVTFNELTLVSQTVQQHMLRGQGDHGSNETRAFCEGSGKQFKRYHELLTEFETLDERTPDLIAELKAAAQAYLDHYEKHGQKQKNDPKNIAKKEACEATIRSLRSLELAAKVQALGEPPWDTAQSMQAASLKTGFDIMSLPAGEQRMETLQGDNKSPTFWINQREGGQTRKTFIFKPGNMSGSGAGFPPGAEPGREALGGRVAEMLNGAFGLKLLIPETQVVEVGRESLPPESRQHLVQAGKLLDSPSYVGSVQKFERAQGSMRDMKLEDIQRIPTRSTQELAVFDTIMLNTDRHAGNFLIRTDQDDAPQLVPIDHGQCLPPRASGLDITTNFGSTHNALLQLPGSHEPYSEDMQKIIERLDPDAFAEMLQRERATIETAHPSIQNTISDDAIESSRRSAMFLKRAAKQLTPAAVQVAIARFHAELFAPDFDMSTFDHVADCIIDEMKNQQEELKEYFLMPKEMQARMKADLAESGWQIGNFTFHDSVLANPANALRLWKSNLKNPTVGRDPNRRPLELDDRTEQRLGEVQRAFPKMTMPRNDEGQRDVLEAWRDWQQLGGSRDKLRDAFGLLGIRDDNISKAFDDVVKAVEYLKRANAVRQLLDDDDTDRQMVDIRGNIAYLEQVRPALSQATRNTLDDVLQRAKGVVEADPPADPKAKSEILTELRRICPLLLDEARSRLLGKLDVFIARTPNQRLKDKAAGLKLQVEACGIAFGYAELSVLDQALADAG